MTRKPRAKKPQKPRSNMGRPTKYDDSFAEKCRIWCSNGASTSQLADLFRVTTRTIQNWTAEHREFFLARRVGEEAANMRVSMALYSRAIGYEYDVEIIKVGEDGEETVTTRRVHTPPDTQACMHWLKNRDAKNWADTQNIQHSGDAAFLQILATFGGEKRVA